jgi:hypothetical protein
MGLFLNLEFAYAFQAQLCSVSPDTQAEVHGYALSRILGRLAPAWRITLGNSEAAIAGLSAPRRKTRGGQRHYCDLAIETTLICGSVINPPLRQTDA